MTMSFHRAGAACGFAMLLGLVGCSGNSGAPALLTVYEVSGKVLLPGDKPLTGGHIYFVPKDGGLSPEGEIASDGTFALSSGPSGLGAPPGNYKIRLEPQDRSLLVPQSPARRAKRLPFARRYLDEDGSGLTATVRAEPNHLEPIRLK